MRNRTSPSTLAYVHEYKLPSYNSHSIRRHPQTKIKTQPFRISDVLIINLIVTIYHIFQKKKSYIHEYSQIIKSFHRLDNPLGNLRLNKNQEKNRQTFQRRKKENSIKNTVTKKNQTIKCLRKRDQIFSLWYIV